MELSQGFESQVETQGENAIGVVIQKQCPLLWNSSQNPTAQFSGNVFILFTWSGHLGMPLIL